MVTIDDIAKKAKVSRMTVSRVINGNAEYIRPTFTDRADKIRKIAAKMGYRPNIAARSVRSGRHGSISLLTSSNPNYSIFSTNFLSSIQNSISALKYNVMLNIMSDENTESRNEIPRILKENSVDGVLVGITHRIPDWLESKIKQMDFPKLWLGSKHDCDCVNHDDFDAGYNITRRLIMGGHTRIAYVDYAISEDDTTKWHFSVLDRMNGYRKAMEEAGLDPFPLRPKIPLPFEMRVDFTVEKLLDTYRPSAVVAYGMVSSGRAVLFAACRRGLRIPDELSLVTFAHSISVENDMRISSFIPNRKYGETVVGLLCEKINNGNKPFSPVVLPFDFIEGDTVSWVRK